MTKNDCWRYRIFKFQQCD